MILLQDTTNYNTLIIRQIKLSMNPSNLYRETITTYLAHVYKSCTSPEEFTTISAHHLLIPESGNLTFPKPEQTEFTTSNTRYFITGISIHAENDNLAQQQNEPSLKIICGGQTWISGQLGLLDLTKLKELIIPIPFPEVEQEVELIIHDSHAKNTQIRGSLTWLCVTAPKFHGEDMPCYRQIICSVPETGIIYDTKNSIIGANHNHISRIEIYVPNNPDVELPFPDTPKMYYDDLAIEPMNDVFAWDSETHNARIHNHVSGPGLPQKSGCKTYYFNLDKSASVIKLNQMVLGNQHTEIKYSIIEKQIVRMKNGYIGLAF